MEEIFSNRVHDFANRVKSIGINGYAVLAFETYASFGWCSHRVDTVKSIIV